MDPNTATYIAFFGLAGLTLLGGLGVVTLKNLLHSALALLLTFIGVAGLYFMLQAEFIAVVQVLLYAGAVMVLILFAIMLTQRLMDRQLHQFTGKWWLAAPFALILFAALIVPAVWGTEWIDGSGQAIPEEAAAALGERLMTSFVLPFEIVSVLLLLALIGAIVVAWPKRDRLQVVDELEQKVARARAGWRRGEAEETRGEVAEEDATIER
jgi:NADH-quinone oxidoreductase subunit J